MHSGSRVSPLQLWANVLIVLLTLALISTDARGSDIIGLGGELPVMEFDVPTSVTATDVTPADYHAARPGDRLLRVRVPVSVVVLRGEVDRVREVIIEIDGAEAGLKVHDFAPDTRLESEQAGRLEVKRTEERRKGIDASLGGALPVAGGVAHVTPSVTTGASSHTTSTVTETRLPPMQAVLVSGAVNHRQGVYFKLRQSSQATLEGEHELSVTFVAPADWQGGDLQVECVARGEKKWLFVKQRKVWNSTRAPIELRLARHTVAKPVAPCECDCCGQDGAQEGNAQEGNAQEGNEDASQPSVSIDGAAPEVAQQGA